MEYLQIVKREYCKLIDTRTFPSLNRQAEVINEAAAEGYRIIAVEKKVIYMVIPDDIQTSIQEREYSFIDSLPTLPATEATSDAS